MISDVPESQRDNAVFYAFLDALLRADWRQADGALRLSADLALADLMRSDFFTNARIFLTSLAETGADTTATGNLNRVFVGGMFESFKLSRTYREETRQVCKVINELDFWALHRARIVSECAGLVTRRKKRFVVTKAGLELLSDERAGELYRKLFIAYFRRYDLQYEFNLRDVPRIQRTMAVILWRLEIVARDWRVVRGLAGEILLPEVHQQLREAMVSKYDTEEWILAGYVLDALRQFGLIERKRKGEFGIEEKDFIRTTELWRKFIKFAVVVG